MLLLDEAPRIEGAKNRTDLPASNLVLRSIMNTHDPSFPQKRELLNRRILELETVVEIMRMSKAQGANNRDVTIGVYQGKVNDLMQRVAKRHHIEEEYRKAKNVLAEREVSQKQIQQEYRTLEQESHDQEAALQEQIVRYEASISELEAHIAVAEERHQVAVEGFQAQVNALQDERDELERCLFDTQERGRIAAMELKLLRQWQPGGAERTKDGRQPLACAAEPVCVSKSPEYTIEPARTASVASPMSKLPDASCKGAARPVLQRSSLSSQLPPSQPFSHHRGFASSDKGLSETDFSPGPGRCPTGAQLPSPRTVLDGPAVLSAAAQQTGGSNAVSPYRGAMCSQTTCPLVSVPGSMQAQPSSPRAAQDPSSVQSDCPQWLAPWVGFSSDSSGGTTSRARSAAPEVTPSCDRAMPYP